MFATRRLLQSCRITLFTRPSCGMCDQAKESLSKVWDARPFAYVEENIDIKGSKWRDLYDFDVPVIHISKSTSPSEDVTTASKAVKLMHRFTPEQVQAKMDEVESK
uniref:Glutaredoxin-like protein n=1 Tax=Bionectria ochroleuca TaxID=29856 RepID=A0A0B7JSQ3_BIOOC